jgi:spoIIIJ-associated protein
LDSVLEEASLRSGRRKEDLLYEIVSEERGFLGVGTRRIAIRVDVSPAPPPREAGSQRGRRGPVRERVLPAAMEANAGPSAVPDEHSPRDLAEEGDSEDVPTGPDPTAPEVAKLVVELVAKAGLELSARMTEADDRIVVDLAGADRELLVDRRGELIDALQYLVNRMARNTLGSVKRIQLESDGFRSDREDELREVALDAAERVRRTGEPVWLPPLNPYERRIVHVTLSRKSGVSTESEGDGFVKRVCVKPLGNRGGDAGGRGRARGAAPGRRRG